MLDAWVIAMGDRLINGTNSTTRDGAWKALHAFSVPGESLALAIHNAARQGYSAVRLKYKIVERDGEKQNEPK